MRDQRTRYKHGIIKNHTGCKDTGLDELTWGGSGERGKRMTQRWNRGGDSPHDGK